MHFGADPSGRKMTGCSFFLAAISWKVFLNNIVPVSLALPACPRTLAKNLGIRLHDVLHHGPPVASKDRVRLGLPSDALEVGITQIQFRESSEREGHFATLGLLSSLLLSSLLSLPWRAVSIRIERFLCSSAREKVDSVLATSDRLLCRKLFE